MPSFFSRNPALLYALFFAFGVQFALSWQIFLLLPILLLTFFATFDAAFRVRLLFAVLFLAAGYSYITTSYQFPELSSKSVYGKGTFQITSFRTTSHPFGKFWIYKGVLKNFEGVDKEEKAIKAKNIPCQIRIPDRYDLERPLADRSYQVWGHLKEAQSKNYYLKIEKGKEWLAVKNSWELAELRSKVKTAVSQFISNHIEKKTSATFLSGIITGDFDDRLISFEFSRFGLQHIMAISGFHFAILSAFLNFVLRFWLGYKRAAIFMILALTLYFLFLGFGPSIMRAYIAIVLFLSAQFFERRTSGLNSLGFAMLLVMMVDPLMIQNLGFQFSFLTTAAILIFFAPIQKWVESVLLKRSLSSAIKSGKLNQHGMILLSVIRTGLSLTIAVNLIALPMTLYYFNKFPWMSLVYNLFFPFMVSVSMLLLLIAIPITAVIPSIGKGLFALNDCFTQFMLDYTFNLPISLDFWLRSNYFSAELLIVYFTFVFGIGILINKKDEFSHAF